MLENVSLDITAITGKPVLVRKSINNKFLEKRYLDENEILGYTFELIKFLVEKGVNEITIQDTNEKVQFKYIKE